MADDIPDIGKDELDLTEAELNKIFFGGDNKPSEDSKPIQSKPLPSKPIKLDRKNTAEIVKKVEKAVETNTPVETEPEEFKRPQGRPKKWTDEKIRQLKEEKRKLAEQRRIERTNNIRVAKMATNEPLTKYESDRILDSIIKSKKEIEETISNKRKEIKTILKNDIVNYSRGSTCKEHAFRFAFYDISGAVAVCKNCSAEEHFSTNEWKMYIARNRGAL